jgi:hypothetical protein
LTTKQTAAEKQQQQQQQQQQNQARAGVRTFTNVFGCVTRQFIWTQA